SRAGLEEEQGNLDRELEAVTMQEWDSCRIVAGRSPASVFCEGDVVLGLMSIGPVTRGRAMIIRKRHAAYLEDLDEETGRHRWTILSLLIVVLTLAACAPQPTPTATAPPSTAPRLSPTPAVQPPADTSVPADTAVTTETPSPAVPTEEPGTAAPTLTSAPPEPSATPTPGATIHMFEANVDIADPGDTITLTWHWSGADAAGIYHHFPAGQLGEPQWQVGPTGSLKYTIPPETRNYETFSLHLHRANDEGRQVAVQTLQIKLRCPDEWFFSPAPDICPVSPATVTDGAEQHFEHGVMLWNRAEGRIHVLFEPSGGWIGGWRAYTDHWEEGDPLSDPDVEPPPGFYQPMRGFGLLWREGSHVRERLGWAIDREQGYETALQHTSHYRYRDLYIRALDGGVWKLGPNGSSWEHISTEGG
ncbi:MAG: hypothetical protein ACOC7N_03725, partial [Chloroflexota bacterium]